jgi:predicted nuclease of predicted toxin-antitoxin system
LKVIIDMNMSPRWAEFLRGRGHDARHWLDVGDGDASDEEIAKYCLEQDAVVLSQDLDFAGMHAINGTTKPSVVQIRSKNLRPESIGSYVAHAFSKMEKQLQKGAVVTVMRPRLRLARLPIGGTENI